MRFKRPQVRYADTPQPATPYQSAAQVWDERIGSARVQAKNWRYMAFGSLILSAGFAAALVLQSARGTVVPWVVQVDKLGQSTYLRYREALGERFVARVLPDTAASRDTPPFFEQIVGCPHSVVTAHLIDAAGEPTDLGDQRVNRRSLGCWGGGWRLAADGCGGENRERRREQRARGASSPH